MKTLEGHDTSAFAQTLGCRFIEVGDGKATVALTHQAHLACSAAHGFDQQSVTVECKVNYMRAVKEGEVICQAQVIHAGRRTLVVEASVMQGEKLIAKAQGTFAVV